MPTDPDPNDPKWMKDKRDPKDRGPAPAPEEERHDKHNSSDENVAPQPETPVKNTSHIASEDIE
jgi:hypothetical protein